MNESLRKASQEGNVSDLYRVIEDDGNVLKRIDKVEFIDTPLHVAADAGCIDFAMEIVTLKPSFARKLNPKGLSPIHLALKKGHKELVENLMENDKDLVRLKGEKGETPLHYVTKEGKLEHLRRFLKDCPDSVRDLTTRNQTALHIAVINNKEEALKILCNILRKADYCEDVVNQKDRNGDTALHIAARENRKEMIKLLLKCKADKADLAGSTTQQLDTESRCFKILRGSFLQRLSTFKYRLEKQVLKHVRNASELIFQGMDSISSEDRNALLVILALLLTVTFQAGISPPGSVWSDPNLCPPKPTKGNHEKPLKKPGTSIMDAANFLLFYIPTCAVFIVTFFLTLGLLKAYPRGFRTALQLLLACLAICFFQSIHFLAPPGLAAGVIYLFSISILYLMTLMCISYRVSQLSVLIIGFWLLSRDDGFIADYSVLIVAFWSLLFLYDKIGKGIAVGVGYFLLSVVLAGFLGLVLLGSWLFLFLYDEFWKGSLLVVAIFFNVRAPFESMIILGTWLFLGVCRFCINRYNICRWIGALYIFEWWHTVS